MGKTERNYDLIVFDWDGTLMDSTALIVDSFQAASADLGLPIPEREEAAQVIGLSLAEATRRLAPTLDLHVQQSLAERYRHHYLARDQDLVLFSGTLDLLHWLKDEEYVLAIATGKARRGLSRVLETSGIGPMFASSRCADESHSKPHPAMLLELMDELMVEPERTLMVGDTTHDLLMARNAGVEALAMTYGAHSVEELQGAEPLALLHSMAEVRAWLELNG